MARKKKSSKSKEFEAETVVVDESIYLEAAETEVVVEVVESSTVIDLDLARQLSGSPVVFGEENQSALKRLVEEGIAADFGKEGHARGHKWRSAVK